MPRSVLPQNKKRKKDPKKPFHQLTKPSKNIYPILSPLQSRGDRPLHMTLEDQLNALIYFLLEGHSSERYLLQALE